MSRNYQVSYALDKPSCANKIYRMFFNLIGNNK